MYFANGEHDENDEALKLDRRTLEIDEASYGNDHPIVAIRIDNVVCLFCETFREIEALPLFRRAYKIFVESLGHDHPHAQTVMSWLEPLANELGESIDP